MSIIISASLFARVFLLTTVNGLVVKLKRKGCASGSLTITIIQVEVGKRKDKKCCVGTLYFSLVGVGSWFSVEEESGRNLHPLVDILVGKRELIILLLLSVVWSPQRDTYSSSGQ